jgi:hypothetical protein
MVEAPEDHPEYALDDVTMRTAKDFSSEDMGEMIISHRVISEKKAIKLCREDNDNTTWTDEHLMNVYFAREGGRRE